jgi:hypothetical protein
LTLANIRRPKLSIQALLNAKGRFVPITHNGKLYGVINMLDLVKYRLSQIDAEAEALKAYVTGGVR